MTITVAEFYTRMSYGQLSNLAMAETPGQLSATGKPKVLAAANDALLRLYSRFVLKEANVLIEMHSHITFYHLIKRFSRTEGSTSEEYRYILDLPWEVFEDDVIKPTKVTDSTGNELKLNDPTDPWSVTTPQGKILQVPRPVNYRALSVLYQASHKKLVEETDVIEVPETLLEALCEYTAYKVFSHMNTPESVQKGMLHEQNFEKICADVIAQDLVHTSISAANTRFTKNGWI